MKDSRAVCVYHDTSVMIVDDNRPFLDSLPDNLNSGSNYVLLDSPLKALQHCNENKKYLYSSDEFIGESYDPISGQTINVNFEKINAITKNKTKTNVSPVIVVDQKMPEMSGIELCRHLTNDYKIIMLTAESGTNLAVDAFNDGIIDKFIQKDDPNVFQKLDDAIANLKLSYFKKPSFPITQYLATSYPFTFLDNPNYHKFFNKLLIDNKIREYYLIDPIGSFLLIDDKKHQLKLVAQSINQIENYISILENNDDFPSDIADTILKKERLLCLQNQDDFYLPIDEWHTFLHPACTIDGVASGYYSLIKLT